MDILSYLQKIGAVLLFADSAAIKEQSLLLTKVQGLCIDSRKVKPGFVFLALRGERLDGHDYIPEAVAAGASAIIVERPNLAIKVPQWLVENSAETLAALAKLHRQTISCPIIALTGSNGKTSVKEMIAELLPKPSYATRGNLNNHLGLPLSVLELSAADRYAVFELGANHVGEIAYTAAIVKPKVALINNIGPAHIGEFGSIEAIAQTKGEIYQSLDEQGIAIVNADDAFAHFWDAELKNKKVLRFALNPAADVDVHTDKLIFDAQGFANFEIVFGKERGNLQLQVPGEHAVRNALAAASCGLALGLSLATILTGLATFKGVPGRLNFLRGLEGALIIDDSYNANLRSVTAAMEVLAKQKGVKIFVLGDMGELGEWTQDHHEEVGRVAKKLGIDKLLTIGKSSHFSSQSFGESGSHFDSVAGLAQTLLSHLNKNTVVLVKGSRAAAMEKIVAHLVKS